MFIKKQYQILVFFFLFGISSVQAASVQCSLDSEVILSEKFYYYGVTPDPISKAFQVTDPSILEKAPCLKGRTVRAEVWLDILADETNHIKYGQFGVHGILLEDDQYSSDTCVYLSSNASGHSPAIDELSAEGFAFGEPKAKDTMIFSCSVTGDK